MLRNDASIRHALDSFERRELHERRLQASILESQAFADHEEVSVSARLRALSRLGELEEERLHRRAPEAIKFLSDAALRLDEERPSKAPELWICSKACP